MSREIKIIVWCDPHLMHEDTKVEGEPVTIGVEDDGSGTPALYDLDVCQACKEGTTFLDLLQVAMHRGRQHGSDAVVIPKPGRFACTRCPKDYSTQNRLDKHLSDVHGLA